MAEQAIDYTGNSTSSKFAIPIKMGLLIAIIKMAFSAVQYAYFLESYTISMVLVSVSFITGMALIAYTGVLQKRKMGVNAAVKEVFQAIFITILIVVVLNFIFDQVYMHFDAGMIDRIYAGKVSMAKNAPDSQNKLKILAEEFALEKKETLNTAALMQQLFSHIIKYSFLGFIFAIIISRNKPVTA